MSGIPQNVLEKSNLKMKGPNSETVLHSCHPVPEKMEEVWIEGGKKVPMCPACKLKMELSGLRTLERYVTPRLRDVYYRYYNNDLSDDERKDFSWVVMSEKDFIGQQLDEAKKAIFKFLKKNTWMSTEQFNKWKEIRDSWKSVEEEVKTWRLCG